MVFIAVPGFLFFVAITAPLVSADIVFAEPLEPLMFLNKCGNISSFLSDYCDPTYNFGVRQIHLGCGQVDLNSSSRDPCLRFAKQFEPEEFYLKCDVLEDTTFCQPNSNSSEVQYIYVGCGDYCTRTMKTTTTD